MLHYSYFPISHFSCLAIENIWLPMALMINAARLVLSGIICIPSPRQTHSFRSDGVVLCKWLDNQSHAAAYSAQREFKFNILQRLGDPASAGYHWGREIASSRTECYRTQGDGKQRHKIELKKEQAHRRWNPRAAFVNRIHGEWATNME